MRRTPAGLSSGEAARLLAEHGRNTLDAAAPPHWVRRLGRNFIHLFALLLWAGAGLAAVGGMPELSVAIVCVIVVNAVFSFAQEFRAECAVEALRRILPQVALVRRDGLPQQVAAEELVPGDVLPLAAGDRISADARLLSSVELRVDMSTLTGESRPVSRYVDGGGDGPDAPGRVFAGTHVFAGTAEASVTATGMATELGRIAGLTQRADPGRSPLEREMDHVTRVVALLSVTVGATFFLLAGALGMGTTERFLFAIGVIVANVPEGLLPTVTLSLARRSAWRGATRSSGACRRSRRSAAPR